MAPRETTHAKLQQDHNEHHLFQPAAHPRDTKSHPPRIISRGEGVYIEDTEGNRVVDGSAGLWCVNAGYSCRPIIAAITEQLGKLPYYTNFAGTATPPTIELAKRLASMLAPEDMTHVYFSSGGSDAVETALKIARQYWKVLGQPDRHKFISLKQGYHGTHFGGLSLTGAADFRRSYEPVLPGCFRVDAPWTFRNPYTEDPESLGRLCAELLDREIQSQGPDTVAAFIVEPVLGAGGVIVPPPNYWPLIRNVCDKHGVLLIADEVVSGFGRLGYMFGVRAWGVKPDIMTFAKGITSGYIPLGATMVSRRISDVFLSDSTAAGTLMLAHTYSGHPVACAAALAALDEVEANDYPANAAKQGERLLAGLKSLERHPLVGEVRGKGLMIGVELVADKKTREPLAANSDLAKKIGASAFRHGAMIRASRSLIIISPPLIIQGAEIDVIVGAVQSAIREVA